MGQRKVKLIIHTLKTVTEPLFLSLSLTLQGTLDVGMIDSVCASDNPERLGPASNIISGFCLC